MAAKVLNLVHPTHLDVQVVASIIFLFLIWLVTTTLCLQIGVAYITAVVVHCRCIFNAHASSMPMHLPFADGTKVLHSWWQGEVRGLTFLFCSTECHHCDDLWWEERENHNTQTSQMMAATVLLWANKEGMVRETDKVATCNHPYWVKCITALPNPRLTQDLHEMNCWWKVLHETKSFVSWKMSINFSTAVSANRRA